MNEHDPLETELEALQPSDPTPQLRQRIAERLDERLVHPTSRGPRFRWSVGLTGVLAICLVAGLLMMHRPSVPPRDAATNVAPTTMPLASAFDDALPSHWIYQRALARSADEVEALLDKHASLGPQSSPAPAHVFIRSDHSQLFHGEL